MFILTMDYFENKYIHIIQNNYLTFFIMRKRTSLFRREMEDLVTESKFVV